MPRKPVSPGMRALLVAGMLAVPTFSGAGTPRADPAQPQELGGRPFSNPDEIFPMPEEWIRRPIRHAAAKPVDLALALDQQLAPALLPLVEAFARERKIEAATQEGTCGITDGALAEKQADIGGYCCPPAGTDRLPGLKFHTIGISAIAIIVHPDNPIQDLTLKEVRELFGGKIERWSDLPVSGIKDASPGPARAVARLHCKLRPGHWRLILDNGDQFGTSTQEVGAIVDMISQVAKNPGTIGWETLWHVAHHANHGKVKTVRIDGVDPRDGKAIAEGRYPLYRVFNISNWTEAPAASALADEMVAYLKRRSGDIDPSYGIVLAKDLRAAGWKFKDDEVVGEPQ